MAAGLGQGERLGAAVIGSPAMVPFILWGGILYDLLIVPALLWRRTRVLAIVASLGFHLTNATLFNIGIFPWMMLGATTLFFEPDWPRRVPGLRNLLRDWEVPMTAAPGRIQAIWIPVSLWLAVQIAMPLRHHIYPGDVAWTEEGHNFSWRMKLRSNRGKASFRVRDPETGNEWRVNPQRDLNKRQLRKMAGKPDLILQYAHYVAEVESEKLGHRVEVRADVFNSLNYRKPQRLIDPERDLAQVEASLLPADWILPFEWTPVKRP
ncbi:MAG: HTTM domain-containing protein [Deltaproteobacteria bacterium]|nr:HTTM domain-containing protein [Deltaproteobacteria bacterium]